MRIFQRVGLAGAAVLFFWVLGWAQTGTSSLHGTITDQQRAAIPGATVTLSNPNTGYVQSTETDKSGLYQFLQVPPGTYNINISKAGFGTVKHQGLQLLVAVPVTFNLTLQVHSAATVVQVTGAPPEINTQDATVGNAFDTSQITNLPFEGRDPTQILSIQPGVAYVGTNVNQNQDDRGGSVDGARSDQTSITLDGVDNSDQVQGYAFQGALRSTLDSLQEFRVVTTDANADMGRSSGAQVSLVTKSGTDSFHGSAYDYNRTDLGEANDWFNKQAEGRSGEPNLPGQLIRNTYGATFGGPIRKNRLFFFLAYEGQSTRESEEVTRVVPSDNYRQGILSYHCSDDPTCPASGIEMLTPSEVAKMDPHCTSNGTCPLGAGPDPAVLSLLQQYPQPNTIGGDGLNTEGFAFPGSIPGRLNTYVARFDFNVTQKQHVFVRLGLNGDRTSLTGPEFPGQPQGSTQVNTSKGLILGYTATLSPTLVNNFHYGYIREGVETLGLQTKAYIDLSGVSPLYGFTPTDIQNVPAHDVIDDVSWVKGNHLLQFGTNLRFISNDTSSNDNSFNQINSDYQWIQLPGLAGSGASLDPAAFGFPAVNTDSYPTYNESVTALTGLLLRSYSNFNFDKKGVALPEGAPAIRHFRSFELEWYGEDSWHVRPNLVVNYGLRYSLLQPPYETTGLQAAPTTSLSDFFNKRAAAMRAGETYDPLVTIDLSGQANGRAPYWDWDYKNLAPRFSLAWSPGSHGRILDRLLGGPGNTAVRAGFGIYYDHFGEEIVDTFDRNGTFGLTTSIANQVGQFSIDDAPRFTGLYDIPSSMIAPPPSGGFPKVPFANTSPTIYWGLDDKLRTPYAEAFDLSVQRQLPKGFTFEADYVGRLGRHLLQEEDMAMPLDITDPRSGMDYFTAATMLVKAKENGVSLQNLAPIPFFEDIFPGAAGSPVNVAAGVSCAPGAATFTGNTTATQAMYDAFSCSLHNETFPLFMTDSPAFASGGLPSGVNLGPGGCYPSCATINGQITPNAFYQQQFSSLYAWRSIGTSSYNALQVILRHKEANGLQWDFNYTYSKSLDAGSNAERISQFTELYQFDQIINSWSPRQLWAPSDFDTTHQISTDWVYELPFGHGRHFGDKAGRLLNELVGGWTWTGVGRWTSGFPTTISTLCCYPTNWELFSSAILKGAPPKTGTFIDQNGNPNLFQDPVAAGEAFRYSYPGESGMRNELRGPGYFGIDSGIDKSWNITESQILKLSWEVFNVTNSVRFNVASLPTSSNGRLDSAGTPVFGVFNSTLTTPRIMQFALRYSF
jgi:hypothetical protein